MRYSNVNGPCVHSTALFSCSFVQVRKWPQAVQVLKQTIELREMKNNVVTCMYIVS